MIGLKTRYIFCRIMSKLYHVFQTVNNLCKKDFPKLIQISIEFRIRNTLMQKFLQTDLIFFRSILTVIIGKCFVEFMMPKVLLKESDS